MKKIFLVLICLLVCGCSKKLTCKYNYDYGDVKISNKIIFNFKDNTYKQKDIMIFSDEDSANEYFNDIKDYIEEYNLVLEKNKIISNIDGDIKKDATKEKLKEQYESYNYKCK